MYISPTLAALVYIRNTAVRCLWPRSNHTVFLWRSQSLAPSARGGSERLAPAKSIAAETPNQKSGGSKDEPIQWKSMDATKSRIITTTAPEQTTSEPRPATTASATWSQTLCPAPLQVRLPRGHRLASCADGRKTGERLRRLELEAARTEQSTHLIEVRRS
jgi:hypothetical protein